MQNQLYDAVVNQDPQLRKSYLSCQLSKHGLERVINIILSNFILRVKKINKKHENKIQWLNMSLSMRTLYVRIALNTHLIFQVSRDLIIHFSVAHHQSEKKEKLARISVQKKVHK